MELRTIQDWIVRRQFAPEPLVLLMSSFGGLVKTIVKSPRIQQAPAA